MGNGRGLRGSEWGRLGEGAWPRGWWAGLCGWWAWPRGWWAGPRGGGVAWQVTRGVRRRAGGWRRCCRRWRRCARWWRSRASASPAWRSSSAAWRTGTSRASPTPLGPGHAAGDVSPLCPPPPFSHTTRDHTTAPGSPPLETNPPCPGAVRLSIHLSHFVHLPDPTALLGAAPRIVDHYPPPAAPPEGQGGSLGSNTKPCPPPNSPMSPGWGGTFPSSSGAPACAPRPWNPPPPILWGSPPLFVLPTGQGQSLYFHSK